MEIRDYLFGGKTRQTVYKSLDAGALRSKVIAENLANVATPGYERKEVRFEEELRKVLEKKLPIDTRDPGHAEIARGKELAQVQPKVFTPIDPTLPGEVNNVDIDIEMTKLAENQILYNFAIRFSGFDKYNAAISGSPMQ
jgi:flagellar basal-body rod protein FlgB